MRKALLILLLLTSSVFKTAGPESSANDRIKVGVFYYPWYVSGYQNGHWSGNPKEADPSLPATWWTVVDRPALDWYASNDTRVIRRHLDWFTYAHIDFGIISWWGPYHQAPFYDEDWVKAVFEETRNYAPWFRWVILIEPCYNVSSQHLVVLDQFRNYTYDNYVEKYHDVWLNDTKTGKPFLFWTYVDDFNNDTVRSEATNDSRLEIRLLGQFLPDNTTTQKDREQYIDWYTWSLFWGSSRTSTFQLKNRAMCVLPRYDETRLDPENKTGYAGRMNRTICCDPYLDGSDGKDCELLNGTPLYDKQWTEVLSNAGNLDYVLIATWNDFTERTQIEPCYDLTSAYIGNTTYLLDRTKYWIKQLNDVVPNEVLNITQVAQPNAPVTPSQDVKVNATVTNSSHNIENVWLRYTTNTTTDWNYTQMDLEQTVNTSSNVYNGTIPPQQSNTLVNFTVIACDNASNCLIDDKNGEYYDYIVVPEFSLLPIMIFFIVATLVVVICTRPRLSRVRDGLAFIKNER